MPGTVTPGPGQLKRDEKSLIQVAVPGQSHSVSCSGDHDHRPMIMNSNLKVKSPSSSCCLLPRHQTASVNTVLIIRLPFQVHWSRARLPVRVCRGFPTVFVAELEHPFSTRPFRQLTGAT
eukprot:2523881-Rhodomonas_salina.1